MKKRITVLTATRAEYGLLKPVIKKLLSHDSFSVRVVVTGAHLSSEFGLTYREIEQDEIPIHQKIEILLSADTPAAISKSMGLAMISFSDYFAREHTDGLLVLGDRYETLAVCCAAMNAQIPIFHINGGDTTQGAVDEAIRHSITKMSYLHFTSTSVYRNRVIQLGESPDRVFNVGALGVENALNIPLMAKKELEESISFSLGEHYMLFTFHPVTLEQETKVQMTEILDALDAFPDIKVLFTKANADANGRIINQMIDGYCQTNERCMAVDSLGVVRYLSAIKYCDFVIGNSSSGLVEVPSFAVPTINIGDRQKGRLQAESVIDCAPVKEQIVAAIKRAGEPQFRKSIKGVFNPYGDGHTSGKIVELLEKEIIHKTVSLKKKFYDLKPCEGGIGG